MEARSRQLEKKDLSEIKKYENLIYILHNSVVPLECKLGKDVRFAYGGIGTVIHKSAVISDYVAIGQNVTIGGTAGKMRYDKEGNAVYAPFIEEGVYIAAGARILGGIVIGAYSIIGANAVVLNDVEPFSIYAGQPAKKIADITLENCVKYKSFWPQVKGMRSVEIKNFFKEKLQLFEKIV